MASQVMMQELAKEYDGVKGAIENHGSKRLVTTPQVRSTAVCIVICQLPYT